MSDFRQFLEQWRAEKVAERRRALEKEPAEFRSRLQAVLPSTPQEGRYGLEAVDRLGDNGWVGSSAYYAANRVENDHANDPEEKELDRTIAALCRLYLASTPSQRDVIRAIPSVDFLGNLLHFAWRMALRTLRTASAEALRMGLSALSIDDQQSEDYRITLTMLAVLNHAAARTGIDSERHIREIASISSDETRKVLLGFLSRSEALKRIEGFGFREVPSAGGPRIDWTLLTEGPRAPRPGGTGVSPVP